MIDIVLDAEVLKRDPSRRRGAFRALSQLAESGEIRLHISEVAAQEFLTDQCEAVKSKVQNVARAIKELKRLPIQQKRWDELSTTEGILLELEAETLATVEESFNDWCKENKVRIYKVGPSHGKKVIDAYFSGDLPFRSPKERSDIPDAFIWQAVFEICEAHEHVAFVSGDKKFGAACKSGPNNLKSYGSVEELLRESGLEKYLARGVLESQLENILHVVQSDLIISEQVHNIMTDELVGRKVAVHFPIEGAYTVNSVTEIRRPLLGEKVTYYGEGLLAVSFSAVAQCQLMLITAYELAQKAVSSGIQNWRQLDGTTAEVKLSRSHVFGGSLLLALDRAIFENESNIEEVRQQVQSCEVVVDSIELFPGFGDEVAKHAWLDAVEQIEEGDMETEIDLDEEADRVNRAQWFEVPKELCGKYGDIIVKEGARVKIAPLPRFENLVRMFKRDITRRKNRGASSKK